MNSFVVAVLFSVVAVTSAGLVSPLSSTTLLGPDGSSISTIGSSGAIALSSPIARIGLPVSTISNIAPISTISNIGPISTISNIGPIARIGSPLGAPIATPLGGSIVGPLGSGIIARNVLGGPVISSDLGLGLGLRSW